MLRWDVTTRTLEKLPTFAMACLASIGDLPDTVMDRAVVVRMRRRAVGEQVAPFRSRRDAVPLRFIGLDLRAWVGTNLAKLEQAVPEMPLEDRAADTWEPLISVADLAGGDWPGRARKAAIALVGAEAEMDTEGSRGVLLLEDMWTVWANYGRDKMATETILEALHGIAESPWKDINGRGKELDARGLAVRLRPYGIRSTKVRIGPASVRGYDRDEFADAWDRYTPGVWNMGNDRNSAGQRVPHVPHVPDRVPDDNALTSEVPSVPLVPPPLPGMGEETVQDPIEQQSDDA
jgi:hypothetical protein